MAAKRTKQTKKAVKRTVQTTTQNVADSSFPQTHFLNQPFWKTYWLPALILMALSFGLYAAAISFGYVLDDQMTIWENSYVQIGLGGLREIFAYDSFMGYFKEQKFLLEGGRYRPLSLATFALEVELFGSARADVGHFVNILLYGFTGILLMRVLSGLFPQDPENKQWYFGIPFLAALLFIGHPLHVEAVANIKGRDEIMGLFFSLASLYASLKYFDTEKKSWLWGAAAFLLLGLLSKENAITFLAVIPLTLWFFGKVPVGRALSAALPLLLAFFVFFFMRYKAMGYVLNHGQSMSDLMNNPFLDMSIGEKYATIFLTLGWYVKLLFVPHPLTHDYYPYHVPKVSWSDWRALVSFIGYAGMGIWATLNLKNRKLPAYAIWYFLLTLSIVSNVFVSIGTFMNERFLFMPSVGFCLLVAWFLARKLPVLLKEKPDRVYILGAGLALLILAAYSYRTYTRVPDWENALTLNESAVRISTNSARAHSFYATALYENKYDRSRPKDELLPLIDTMEYHVRQALKIHPKYGNAWVMRGIVASARFDVDHQMDRLFNEFDGIIDAVPYNATFRNNMDAYIKYLATSGGNPHKIISFALRNGYDRFYKEKGDLNNAITFLNYGLMTQTEDVRILNALSEVYQAAGDAAKSNEMKRRAEAMEE
jgi:hypothetical protein